jgi:diketogulonate reductase-like aldo/keto reductase
MHPYFVRQPFVDFHKKFNVSITAYAPIGSPGINFRPDSVKTLDLFVEPIIKELAEKYSKSPAQVILAWHVSRGIIIIPKTTKEERLPENIQVLDFKLTEEEVKRIETLDQGVRFFNPLHIRDFGWDNLPYYE